MGRVAICAAAVLSLVFASVPAGAQDAGAALYKTKCAACHGADGKGETAIGKADKIRDLGSAEVQQQSDADLTAIITTRKRQNAGLRKEPEAGASKGSGRVHSRPGEEIRLPASKSCISPQVLGTEPNRCLMRQL